jgi:hypothetical protein
MAKGRFISNTLGESDKFASLKNDRHRLMFVLMVASADAEGRIKADPKWLSGKVYTLLDYSSEAIEEGLAALAQVELIRLYEVDGKRFAEIVKFHEHNKIRRDDDGRPTREAASRIPAPEVGRAVAPQELRRNSAGTAAQGQVQEQDQVEVQVEVKGLRVKSKDEDEGEEAQRTNQPPEVAAKDTPDNVVAQQLQTDYDSSEARMDRVLRGQGNDQYRAAAARQQLRRLLGRSFDHEQVQHSWKSWYETHEPDYIEASWKAAQVEAGKRDRPALFLFIDALNGSIAPLTKPIVSQPVELPPPGTLVEHPNWDKQTVVQHTRRGELILENGATVPVEEVTVCRS